jgi:hypothetical protein
MSTEKNPEGLPEPGAPDRGRLPELSSRSREVVAVLARQKGRPARFYEGALRALADQANPVRAEMAAYALRELIEELERAAAGTAKKGPTLGELVGVFRPKWEGARRRAEDNGLVDPCDPAVFAVDQLLIDAYEGHALRRDRAQETLSGLDPVQRQNPPDTQAARIEALLRFRREFNEALHGERPTDPAAFQSRVEGFETFLLDLFRPRTFAEFDAIDNLLADGPP